MKHSNSVNPQREVVFVKAKIGSGEDGDSYKKFAIDPNITTFNVFLGLLAKCFDIVSDFSVSYLASDDYGEQFYVPMQSDWDLDAAILTSSEPALRVKLNIKPLPAELRDWDIIVPADVRLGVRRSVSFRNTLPISYAAKRVGLHATSFLSAVSDRVGKTVSSVQRAIGFRTDTDNDGAHLSKAPMTDIEFRQYLDNVGRVTYLKQLCWDIFRGGLQPGLRKVGWRLLLSVFPADMTGQERISLLESKTRQYLTMKETWKRAYVQGRLTEQQLATLASVSIDVVRTDWTHAYYCGEENRYRVCQLFDLLATYCIYHPSVGYNQGMSDLASPLLITQQDEATAYLCFCALMRRLHVNFSYAHPSGLIAKMRHLYILLTHKDPKLACFLRMHGLSDMYFTQRWLLLELKREFTFEDCLHLFEVQWASCSSIRLATESNLDQTSNSKSVGHLVLAEEKMITVLDEQLATADQPQRYGARDVSLINSLIGSDYVVRLPGSCENQLKRLAFTNVTRHPGDLPRFRAATLSHTHSLELSSNRPSILPPTDNSHESGSHNLMIAGKKNRIEEVPPPPSQNDRPVIEIQRSNSSDTEPSSPAYTTDTQLPGPDELGYGNPFLLFLCFSLLLEYREAIFAQVRDASDMIAFFQHQSKKHDLTRVVHRARTHFNRYLQDHGFYMP